LPYIIRNNASRSKTWLLGKDRADHRVQRMACHVPFRGIFPLEEHFPFRGLVLVATHRYR
jgi:hypothetical protein